MQTATGETTWPVMGSIKWHRTYYAMVATPLAVADVVAAQLVFVMFRVATVAGVFLLVMAPFGVFESRAGRAARVAGAGAGRAALRAGCSSPTRRRIRSESGFAIIFRLLVIPLFLFSGAFFPISNLPPVAGVAGPAHAAVARRRPDPDARARPGAPGRSRWCTSPTWWCCSLVGWWLAVRRLDRRLEV